LKYDICTFPLSGLKDEIVLLIFTLACGGVKVCEKIAEVFIINIPDTK